MEGEEILALHAPTSTVEGNCTGAVPFLGFSLPTPENRSSSMAHIVP
ncbi:MAG: hypothetical protein OJF50_001578 [Nitrospira sp.]|nr:hypothetical protein [Nitrospira sp.]